MDTLAKQITTADKFILTKTSKYNTKLNLPTKTLYYALYTLICLILLYCLYRLGCWLLLHQPMGEITQMKRPFLNMWGIRKDGTEFLTNIVFITHPFTRDECIVQYNDAKSRGVHFLGLSSYSEFPGPVSNIHDVLHDTKLDAWTKYNYFELTRGWLSCFREENNRKWIKDKHPEFPVINIAESDFANYESHQPDPTVAKDYDFIYVCLKDGEKKPEDKDCPAGWQSYNRNYEKAKLFLDVMCKKYKLKGLLVGRIGCAMPPNCHNLMELTDFMEYAKFIKQYNRCKFIFLPNFSDASPRCLTEAMCFNLPVLMNSNILGGWQYLNDKTGEFFNADDTNIQAFEPILDKFIKKLKNGEYKPREWFIANYGKYNSGKRLKEFVGRVFKPEELNFKMDEVEYLKPGI